VAKRELDAAREGKRGKGVQAVLKALDGYKRVVMVLVFGVASIIGIFTGDDYKTQIDLLFSLVGWDRADAAVNATVVGSFVVAAWAVIDGLRKAARMKQAQKGIIPPEQVVFPPPSPAPKT
jgi:hypothetical protein